MKFPRKLTSILLLLSILFSLSQIAYAEESLRPENGEFIFSSRATLNYIKDPYSVDLSYDSFENSMKMVVNNQNGGIDPRALLDLSSLGLRASDYKSLLVIYKVPAETSAKSHSTELFISAGNVSAPTAGKSVTYTITKANSYTAQIVDLSSLSWWSGSIHSIRIDPFTSASVGDTMYIHSISLCTDNNDAVSRRDAKLSELNKIETPENSSAAYICTEYEYDKYTSPFWKGNIVYNEAVYPIKDKDGNSVYTLMYTPDKITSVYTSDFSSLYYEDIDYTVEGNKITFLKSGNIRLKDYTYIHPQSNPNGYDWSVYYNRTAAGDGKWEYWGQSPEFYNGYINVTYTHSDTWDDYIPENKSDEIPLTAYAIENRKAMNIVFYGDSICGGANSSSYRDVYPYAEYWNEMIVSKLRNDYKLRINATYSSVGGSTASDMVQYIDREVTSKAPDLVFIEFGANDAMNESQSSSGSLTKLKREYKSAVINMIEEVRDTYPECEFVLVAPFYCNPYCHYMSYFEACRDALNEIAEAYSGVTVADITSMQKSMLEYKDYLDFSGDNMCHPNDYMARIYAQVCLETIVPGGISPYTVSDTPPANIPDVGNTSVASPSGHGWQWPTAEAYGYIGNYGSNSQDIELTFDVSLISSASEEAVIRYYTPSKTDIYITENNVKIGSTSVPYDWGQAKLSNWHKVTIKILNGNASVFIDGELVISSTETVVTYTDYQLLFSYTGCMAIDNVSMVSSTGTEYFNCDFESEEQAKKLMSEGLGSYTILAANTVKYDLNGGNGIFSNQIKVKGTDLMLLSDIPERDGYKFIGWSSDADKNIAEYNPGDIYTVNDSVTLYAIWESSTPDIVLGDVTGDGIVNAQDSNVLKRFMSGSINLSYEQLLAADFNGDGSVNALDSNKIARFTAGTIN